MSASVQSKKLKVYKLQDNLDVYNVIHLRAMAYELSMTNKRGKTFDKAPKGVLLAHLRMFSKAQLATAHNRVLLRDKLKLITNKKK